MSTAQATSNKATLRRFNDAMNNAMNNGDAELISKAIDEFVQPDVLIRTPLPVEAAGAQALKQVWAVLLRAFPDLHVAVEDVIAEGDKVVCRNTVTGTHQGEYMGRQPANPSRTTRSSSSGSSTAGSLRPGGSSTSSRRCDSSA